ncbi:hypothetical protein CRP01_37845 [Flavilitoribacter nigricans DSM 23189 = NBRC 102662]|uniref:Bacterial surface antigen (D15) domain-containing protein n=1 Tax=Flavilitoribacter nigricans (strain ATCC 23147 / DSM 23189 / NBRC 102662 / NCIMB 1420 / SS-2) TaxID=1122177 RepID=A0A2D0MYX9_FLAN2|nr:hypothetical protein CRP01_37845 [Flavilitoribacter nigricans DSM 23189 = NBRC 102662]
MGLSAQISRGAFIGNSDLHLTAYPEGGNPDLGYNLLPELKYFLSPHFSIGGNVRMTGSREDGVNSLRIAPEVQYIFNPQQQNNNWFVFLNPRFNSIPSRKIDSDPYTEIFTGLGWYAFLSPNIVLQTKLAVIFDNRTWQYFVQRPVYQLSTGLSWYLDPNRSFSAVRQIPERGKGSWMIGGIDPEINLRPARGATSFRMSLTPRVGYFLSDQLVVGLGVPFAHIYESNLLRDLTKYYYKSTVIGAEPYLRFYTGRPEQATRFFAEGSARFAREHLRTSRTDQPRYPDSGILTFRSGFNYFLRPTVALEGSVFYLSNFTYGYHQFGLTWGFQFFLLGNQ